MKSFSLDSPESPSIGLANSAGAGQTVPAGQLAPARLADAQGNPAGQQQHQAHGSGGSLISASSSSAEHMGPSFVGVALAPPASAYGLQQPYYYHQSAGYPAPGQFLPAPTYQQYEGGAGRPAGYPPSAGLLRPSAGRHSSDGGAAGQAQHPQHRHSYHNPPHHYQPAHEQLERHHRQVGRAHSSSQSALNVHAADAEQRRARTGSNGNLDAGEHAGGAKTPAGSSSASNNNNNDGGNTNELVLGHRQHDSSADCKFVRMC